MALSRIWVSMICVALAFGAASGRGAQLGAAAAQGVQQAVDFCLTVGGMICLWSGVMELMRRCGIAGGLSRCCGLCCGGCSRTPRAMCRRSMR